MSRATQSWILCLLGANSALLWLIDVSLWQQLQTLVALCIFSLAGSALLLRIRGHFPDRASYWVVSFLLGVVCAIGLSYLLLGPLGRVLLGELSFQFASRLVWVALGAFGGWGLWRRRKAESSTVPVARQAQVLAIAILALGLAISTSYGHYNNSAEINLQSPESPPTGLRNWGWSFDWWYHFGVFHTQLKDEGLSPRMGVPLLALSCTPFGPAGLAKTGKVLVWPSRLAKTGKALVWPFYFALLYLFYVLAADAFRLPPSAALATVLSTALFAPINLTFLFGELRPAYTGFVSAAPTLYHNFTQLTSFAIGMAAITLVSLRLRGGAPSLLWAAVLTAGSFTFKPSFFTIAAPTFFLFIVVSKWRFPLRWRKDEALASLVLLAVPALYQLYQSAGGAPEVRSILRPFHVLFLTSGKWWPDFVLAQPVILGAMIVITSMALMICLAVVQVWTAVFRGADTETERENDGLADGPTRVLALACLTLCVLGVASGTLFAFDDPRLVGSGDFLWASGQGLLIALPVSIALIVRVRWAALRIGLWWVLGLHLASGVVHLWFYVVEQRLK